MGLFARKARCANCGYTMRSSKNHGRHYLQCSNRVGHAAIFALHHVANINLVGEHIGDSKILPESAVFPPKDACIGSFISVEKLERMVIDELNRLAAAYLDKDELERSIEFCENLQGQKKQSSDRRRMLS